MKLTLKALLTALLFMMTTSMTQAAVLLKDLQDHTISLAELKGKWVLINYWAGWCGTCVEEIPELNKFYQKYANTVALLAVNYDALPLKKQKNLIKKLNILYPSLASDPAAALGLGDIAGVPVTFVINPQGELINTLYGGQNIYTLEKAISMK